MTDRFVLTEVKRETNSESETIKKQEVRADLLLVIHPTSLHICNL
jgi:hypothetical protein